MFTVYSAAQGLQQAHQPGVDPERTRAKCACKDRTSLSLLSVTDVHPIGVCGLNGHARTTTCGYAQGQTT